MKNEPLNSDGNTPAYSTIISNLETRYKNLEGLPEGEFFIGIADYMKYIEDIPELASIIESIQQERVGLDQEDYRLQQIVYKDMKNVASEVSGAIKKKNISFPELDEVIREYNLMHGIADLEDIIRALYENGYSKLVENFVIVTKDKKNILDFKISDSYLPCMKVRKALTKGYRTALWGALGELYDVWGTVNSIDRPENYLIRDRMLTKKDYLNKLFRVHRHIIEKLSKNDENKVITTLADGFPLELILAGKVLKIQGYVLQESVKLISMQTGGTAVILELIFKVCRSKPTTWKTISKKKIEAIAGFNNVATAQKVFKNPTQFSKYISGIGLKGHLRKLFVGKIDNQNIRMRTAVPSKDWDSLSVNDQKEVVNTLLEKASSRN